MGKKRVTIYDLAKALNISPSYISKALNNNPIVNKKTQELVKKKADELNYKHNSQAANLRQGATRTIGVIVPHIHKSIFAEAIAGIEEACFAHNYSLIICQSHESYDIECKAIDMLVHQNVDCILISLSAETVRTDHFQTIKNSDIELIQFDRYIDGSDCLHVVNNEKEISIEIVNHFINGGYKQIAFLGGPEHQAIFQLRKKGYLQAMQEANIKVPENFIVDNVLSKEMSIEAATKLLSKHNPPDAFFTVSDQQALGVLMAANALGIAVPAQLGIIGFGNEDFTEISNPTLSSVNQKSKELGKRAANLYLDSITKDGNTQLYVGTKEVVDAEIIIRDSSKKALQN